MKIFDKFITSQNLKRKITSSKEKSIIKDSKVKIMPIIFNNYNNNKFNSSYYGNPFPFDWYKPDNFAIKTI